MNKSLLRLVQVQSNLLKRIAQVQSNLLKRIAQVQSNLLKRIAQVGTPRVPRIFSAFHAPKMVVHSCTTKEGPITQTFPKETLLVQSFLGRTLTLLAFCATTLLSGCTTLEGQPFAVQDPYEGANRKVYGVIDGVDRLVIAPLARGYRTVMPDLAERGVSNFFRNLRRIDSVANSILQGKPGHAGEDLAGLLVNSTVGIGGLIDVGTGMGLKHHEEDFGQTLAVWGVTRTSYIYLPPGPSTLRDAPGTFFKSYLPELLLSGGYSIWVSIIDLLAIRAEALPLSDARDQAALDPYVFTRDAYYQRREYVTFDGDPPLDDFLEELDELEDTLE